MSDVKKVFVLMPFDEGFTSIYEHIIKPAFKDVGYEVSRADSFIDQQNIIRDIVNGIANADLVVADLTNLNPNVLYELGLCHALKIPTILLSQSIEEVPFDLRSYRIQVYSDRIGKSDKIKEALKEIGDRHKDGKISFGSPIIDFWPSVVVNEKAEEETSAELMEDTESKGIFDFLKENNESAEEISNIISEMSSEANIISQNIMNRANQILQLSASPGLQSASKVHKIATIIANDINIISNKFEISKPKLEKNIDIMIESYSGYLTWIRQLSETQPINISNFRNNLDALLNGAKTFLTSLDYYKNSVSSLMRFSKDINRSCKRLYQAIDEIKSQVEIIEAFCIKTLYFIDEKYQ